MQRIGSVFILLGIVVAITAIAGTTLKLSVNKPAELCDHPCNVILIVIDTLSAKHIAVYGYERDTMPRTTKFFEESAIFFDASSVSPWTFPSFNALYYSASPSSLTFKDIERNTRPSFISALRDAGWNVYGIGRMFLKNRFQESSIERDANSEVVRKGRASFIGETIRAPFEKDEQRFSGRDQNIFVNASTMLSEIIKDTATPKYPFFFLIHSFDVHDPYEPSDPYNTLFRQTDVYPVVTQQDVLSANQNGASSEQSEIFALRYDQEIREIDDELADFLESIPKETLDNTIIILTSDHGEAFNEHGKVWHGSSLFQEQIAIPLFIRAPNINSKIEVKETVSLIDIGPTILSSAIIPIPKQFKGKDLTQLILYGSSLEPRMLPIENGRPFPIDVNKDLPISLEAAGVAGADKPIIDKTMWGARKGVLKYIATQSEQMLFDIAHDPEEKENLLERQAVGEQLTHEQETFLEELGVR
jgi:arylsulfatase